MRDGTPDGLDEITSASNRRRFESSLTRPAMRSTTRDTLFSFMGTKRSSRRCCARSTVTHNIRTATHNGKSSLAPHARPFLKSEESRVGKECVSTGRYQGRAKHK